MTWQIAEKVQKNSSGDFRAFIGGEWIPVARAQKSASGQYRVELNASTPVQKTEHPYSQVPQWGQDNPSLYSMAGAARDVLSPLVEMGGLIAGGIVGAASGGPLAPATGVVGAGLGYGAGRAATNQMDVWLGNRPDPGLLEAGKESAKDAATGMMYETGSQAVPAVTKGLLATKAGEKYIAGPARSVANKAANFVDSFSKAGSKRVAGRTLVEAAGDDSYTILKLLDENKQLPGGAAGTGEVAAPAGRAEFSALQKPAEKAAPTEFGRMRVAENQARANTLREISPGDLKKMEAGRSKLSSGLYKKSFQETIKADQELLVLAKDPFFKIGLKEAEKLAASKGLNPKDNLIEYLHQVKMSLDDQLMKTGDNALGRSAANATRDVQKRLVKWMGIKSPNYEAARLAHAEASIPIDQRKVAQYLEDKLVAPIGEEATQRGASYATAERDAAKTIKNSTGGTFYDDLNQVFTPDDLARSKAVSGNLTRKSQYETLARDGMHKALGLLDAQTPKLWSIGMWNANYSVARAVSNRLAGKVTANSMKILEEAMAKPELAAELMRQANKVDFPLISEAFHQAHRAIAAGAAASQEQ
jgi:hypothetical protein